MAEKKRTELAVIGAGPGGYPAAFLAADLGMKVTLIDVEPNPGGVCLYRGCIPTKTLLHVAQVVRESKEARKWGVDFSEPVLHPDKMKAWKDRVITKMTMGLGQLSKQRKIDYIRGKARFTGSQTLHIDLVDGGETVLEYDKAILATGSRPATVPVFPEDPKIMTSAQAMEMENIPDSMLVIGGGYIGLEMGTIYASLGTDVSVVEMMPQILPGADQDLVRTYQMTARKLFKEIMTDTKVASMRVEGDSVRVTFEGPKVKEPEKAYDRVIISIGRKPNSENLGLENTEVKLDDRGFVIVNPQRQTDDGHVFAIGDVVGGAMLAHKATHEGRIAVEAIQGKKVEFAPKAIPAVLFTDPEVAWAGVTENEAEQQGLNVDTAKFPWGGSGRASSLGRMDGLTKLIVDKKTEQILGIGLVGPGAGELVAEGALAIEMGLKASDLAHTIHPHPTLSETLMEAAESYYGTCPHLLKPKK